MGLRQLHTAETMFIDDGLTDGAVFPPSSNAVYDALQNTIELPPVTAEDDGDVLTVVSGAWAKATPSGLQVDYILQDGESGVTIESGTFTDISAKLKNGEPVIGIWRSVFEDSYETDYITQHTYDDYSKQIFFSNGNSVGFIWSENGTIERD